VREVRKQETVEEKPQCFKCGEKEHKKWECPKNRKRKREEKVAPLHEVWKKVKEHSGVRGLPPRGAVMCIEGWITPKEVVTFVEYMGCKYKSTKPEENKGQCFLSKEQWCNMWCGRCKEAWNWRDREAEERRAKRVKCSMCGGKGTVIWKMERNEKGEIFCPPCKTGKKMLWWNWGGKLEWTVLRAQKERAGITDLRRVAETVNQKAVQKKGKEREVRQTFKPLRKVWMNVGIEKIDMHEERTVKVLLNSGATGMFMSKSLAQKGGYRLIKLDQPLQVRNVDGTSNSGDAITHEVEVNMFYKGHVKRVRMDVCKLGKTDVILGMLWLAAHNPEIDWEKGEVRITRCPPLYGKAIKIKGKKKTREDERRIVR